ncbi:MAG: hypothetical protein HY390_03630 [Deltaproteobacteria bacterium]|nr:hypothetical protein [Deltaproteobacteria bacterium]
MKTYFLVLTFFLFSFPLFAAQEKVPEILSVKGFLYYHGVGGWSENIFNPDFNIWNSSIGEGSLKHPSNRTLFVIEANKNTSTKADSVFIKIQKKVKDKIEILYEKKHKFSFLEENQNMHVPVFLESTTFGEFIVTAYICDFLGKKISPIKESSVKYGGGE